MNKETTLSVADLFCGAGGFSEGFRKAGFNVIFGLDNWQYAIKTFQFNHSEAKCAAMSILDVTNENINEIIPDTDVIIGSPPCTYFSKSNKAGKGDKREGMGLVMKFLQIVALKKPKFWILENVVGLQTYLKREYTYHELGLKGGDRIALKIPNIITFNSSDFGVPQNRYRLICGDFPIPEFTNANNHVALKKILQSLPNPEIIKHEESSVIDPNYNFKIKGKFLSDHFYSTKLEKFQWAEAKRLKIDHSYYGRMSFPEDIEKPSRTVMATLSKVSRESMILGASYRKQRQYRLPTIREIACMQSYPIDYQFIADREEMKYRLVGNSVPPLMAYHFAVAIVKKTGIVQRARFSTYDTDKQPPFNLNGIERKRVLPRARLLNARFRVHVPFLKIRNFRVDLDNLSSNFELQKFIWLASIHHGTGKLHAEKANPSISELKSLIKKSEYEDKFVKLDNQLEDRFDGKIPDSLGFQKIYCRMQKVNGFIGPHETLSEVRKLVDQDFPVSKFSSIDLINEKKIEIKQEKIPLPIIAALYACKYVESKIKE